MAGKRKKTPEVEKAQGYPGKRKGKTEREIAALQPDRIEVEHDEETVAGLPNCPAWLTEKGRVAWREIGGDLVRLRILKVSDLFAFARYCDYIGHWHDLRDELTGRGGKLKSTYTMKTAAGSRYRAQDPRYAAYLKIERVLKDLESSFGLNPNARTALLLRLANASAPRAGLPGDTGARAEGDTGRADGKKPASPLGVLRSSEKLN